MLLFASFLIDSTSLKSGITPWVDTFKICNVPVHRAARWADSLAGALAIVRGTG